MRLQAPAAELDEPFGDLEVGARIAAAEVVDVHRVAMFEDVQDAARVILDVKPVANLTAVAVERHRFAVDQIGDEERDQLLGILVRAVSVASRA